MLKNIGSNWSLIAITVAASYVTTPFIIRVLGAEGYVRAERPTPRTPAPRDPMQYGTGVDNPLWALALIPGVDGWTALKTAPFELMCERKGGELRLRALGCQFGQGYYFSRPIEPLEIATLMVDRGAQTARHRRVEHQPLAATAG